MRVTPSSRLPHCAAGVFAGWLLWACAVPACAQITVEQSKSLLERSIATACQALSPAAARLSAVTSQATLASQEPLEVRGAVIGWRARWDLVGGGEIHIERFAPGGQFRRLVAEYWAQAPRGGLRPTLAAVADGGCAIRAARRLVYAPESEQALYIDLLDADLSATGEREPLNPPVPAGRDPGGVTVALIDAGVNYLLPEIGRRLARNAAGQILGYDYWDMDRRPFDSHPVPSPFFPQRHGTRTAALLLSEAPSVRLIPYRYPRPDMSRMAALVSEAAAKGVVIANLSMGSNEPTDWDAFAEAAKAHPEMLFVVSAGNNGRDIDAEPVYPAALALENVITVTSSEDTGELAPGSNWGRHSVDLLVPAERLIVAGFDGRPTTVSGSSYAAIRVSALAARLLAVYPGWRAAQLKDAIFARTLQLDPGGEVTVAQGFIPRPDRSDAYPPADRASTLTQVESHVLHVADLYPDSSVVKGHGYVLRPTFAYFTRTAWNLDRLRGIASRTAAILAQCGVSVSEIDVRAVDGPDRYRYFRDAVAKDLVRSLPLSKPTVYFVRDTLQRDAYEAEAIGRANSSTRPALRDTVWVVEDVRDAGIAVAHELVHVLMDSGEHSDAQHNLMRAQTAPSDTGLTPEQCAQLVSAGTENGLLAQK